MLKRLAIIRENITGIFKRMFMIAMYLGVLLSLFAVHRYLLLNDGSLASHIGFSFLNAFALAKVILVGQELRIGDRFRNSALIYVIAAKSAIFAVLLFVFRVIEEAVIGAVEGKNIYDAIFSGHPGLEHGKFEGMILSCIIVFFALMPFFAYLEFERVLGDKRMHALMFGGASESYVQADAAYTQAEADRSDDHSATESTQVAAAGVIKEGLSAVSPDTKEELNSVYRDQWFYERAGEVMGPVNERELARLLFLGIISKTTLVHNASVGEGWRFLQETEVS